MRKNRILPGALVNVLVVGVLFAIVLVAFDPDTKMDLTSPKQLLTMIALMIVAALTGFLTTSYARRGSTSLDEVSRIIAAELKKESRNR